MTDDGRTRQRRASAATTATGTARRRVTLSDVATAAGLSITQVSRALAGYHDVSETTRARVRSLAQELGYRPSLRAQTLAMGRQAILRCSVVGFDLAASELYHSPYGPLSAGILAGASAERMDVHLASIGRQSPADELARFVAEDRADGVLLVTFAPLRPRDVAPLEDAGVPYVLVNRHFDHVPDAIDVHCVTPTWLDATRDAVDRLHRLGHRRMAAVFVDGTTASSTALDHQQGWREGLATHGIDAVDAPILHTSGGIGEMSGYELGRRMLTDGLPGSGERPTAIVAYNDTHAQGVLRAARELGVDVPGELTVIGFDNSVGQYLWPALCSYDPHFYTVGEQSALLLASLLRGETAAGPRRRVRVPLDYVCRASCAPAP